MVPGIAESRRLSMTTALGCNFATLSLSHVSLDTIEVLAQYLLHQNIGAAWF